MNVKIVINRLHVGASVVPGVLRIAKVGEVHDVSDRIAIGGWSDLILLIQLVVDEDILVPIRFCEGALVDVGSSRICLKSVSQM